MIHDIPCSSSRCKRENCSLEDENSVTEAWSQLMLTILKSAVCIRLQNNKIHDRETEWIRWQMQSMTPNSATLVYRSLLPLKKAKNNSKGSWKKRTSTFGELRQNSCLPSKRSFMLWCDARSRLIQRLKGDIWIALHFYILLNNTTLLDTMLFTYALWAFTTSLHSNISSRSLNALNSNFFTIKYFFSAYQSALIFCLS